MGHHDRTRPRPLRTVSHRLPAPGWRAHRAVQLHLRAPPRRRLCAAHRRHRRVALHRRGDRPDPALAARDGARLGRRPRKARPPRSLPPDRAARHLSRAHRAACWPPGTSTPASTRPRSSKPSAAPLRPRSAPGSTAAPVATWRPTRSPAPGCRRALDAALQRAPRHDGLRRHAARPGRGRKRDHRRLHRAALRRDHHLQPGGGRRRRDDGGEPRHPGRRPPLQHAQADPHLRGAGCADAALPAHAAALRHRPQEALQAPRRDQPRAAHRDGLSGRGGAQLPLLPVDRVRRVDDHLDASPTWSPTSTSRAWAPAPASSTPRSCAG